MTKYKGIKFGKNSTLFLCRGSIRSSIKTPTINSDVLLTVHLSIILAINKLNAQILILISLLYASTCFEHYVLLIRRSELYYIASGIITPVGGRPVHRLRESSLNLW